MGAVGVRQRLGRGDSCMQGLLLEAVTLPLEHRHPFSPSPHPLGRARLEAFLYPVGGWAEEAANSGGGGTRPGWSRARAPHQLPPGRRRRPAARGERGLEASV